MRFIHSFIYRSKNICISLLYYLCNLVSITCSNALRKHCSAPSKSCPNFCKNIPKLAKLRTCLGSAMIARRQYRSATDGCCIFVCINEARLPSAVPLLGSRSVAVFHSEKALRQSYVQCRQIRKFQQVQIRQMIRQIRQIGYR